MSRPTFALALVQFNEDHGTHTSRVAYFASYAGAQAAYWLQGLDLDDCADAFHRIESLQPGKVYDHRADRWVDGLTYQPHSVPYVQPSFDDCPF